MRRFTIMTAAAALTLGAATPAQADTAVLAGGCFWGMEAVFEHVKGVHNVVSGYAGGSRSDANYSAVSAERTRHAEAVKITYDPKQISYARLLQIYFTVAHDPTQLNRQGPDVGRSYRSAVLPQTPAQAAAAKAFIARLAAGRKRIATTIESGPFFAAESEHQDFARKNPFHPYILAHDRPKVAALKRQFPALYKT
jgi:peptide-methionine (S)-S-oxide reductase